MKYSLSLILVVVILSFVGCDSNPQKQTVDSSKPAVKKSIKERGIAYIENNLKINAAEEYDIDYYEEFIDDDTLKDALFIIRRVGYAELKARKANVYDNYVKFGYTANENYIYLYNGKTKKFSTTAPIGASMNQPIEVSFQSITSLLQKNILIKYYILDSKFISYYSVGNKSVYPVLNHPIYANVGAEDEEAYKTEYTDGTFSLAKDINLYKAKFSEKMQEFSEEDLVATDVLYLRFMFDPRKQKYVTRGVENQ